MSRIVGLELVDLRSLTSDKLTQTENFVKSSVYTKQNKAYFSHIYGLYIFTNYRL